jgi:hypothetical protein
VADLMRDLDDETEANRESAVDAVDGAGMDPWEKEAAQESARDAVEVL